MSRGEGGGRPPLYTPERIEAIKTSISNHVPYEIAAKANGITERTLYNWLEEGEDDVLNQKESILSKFFQDVNKIEEKKIIEHMNCINDMPERWQARAWILARRWSKHFSNNAEIQKIHDDIAKLTRLFGDRPNG